MHSLLKRRVFSSEKEDINANISSLFKGRLIQSENEDMEANRFMR